MRIVAYIFSLFKLHDFVLSGYLIGFNSFENNKRDGYL